MFVHPNPLVERMNNIKVKNPEFDRCYENIGTQFKIIFPYLEWFIGGSIRFGYYNDESDIDILVCLHNEEYYNRHGGEEDNRHYLTKIDEILTSSNFKKEEKEYKQYDYNPAGLTVLTSYPETFIQYSGYIEGVKRKVQISFMDPSDFQCQYYANSRVDGIILNNPDIIPLIRKLKILKKGQISGSEVFRMLI